jgi:hypothetical protein
MKYSVSFVNLSIINIFLSALIPHIYDVLHTVDKQAPVTEADFMVFHCNSGTTSKPKGSRSHRLS